MGELGARTDALPFGDRYVALVLAKRIVLGADVKFDHW